MGVGGSDIGFPNCAYTTEEKPIHTNKAQRATHENDTDLPVADALAATLTL
jgi:hypothetical protein